MTEWKCLDCNEVFEDIEGRDHKKANRDHTVSKYFFPIIFRIWEETDEVIAIFPDDIGIANTFGSYMHIGQHAYCDPKHIMSVTRHATSEEREPLRKELRSIGYNQDMIIYDRLESDSWEWGY